jgi:hypothetical protein
MNKMKRSSRRNFLKKSSTVVTGAVLAGSLNIAYGGDNPTLPIATLRVATFQCDVTPPVDGHPLIFVDPVKTIETPLAAKGIVIDDGRRRYVLCAVDWCGLSNSSWELFRNKVAAGAATSPSNVAIQCVHQHTAPYTDGDAQKLLDRFDDFPLYVDFKFLDDVTDRLAAAVKESLGRLQPFDHIGTGQTKVDRVASSRRVITEDGNIHVRFSNTKGRPDLRALPEGYIDPYLKTITLAQGDKPLVRLHYYATHPQSFYGDNRVCSDVPGFARERLQRKENVFQIYFTGCAGDITMGKYNDKSRRARSELTDRLYAGMEASVAATRMVPVGPLQWRSTQLLLPPRTDEGYTLADAIAKMSNARRNPGKRVFAAAQAAFAERIVAKDPVQISSLQIGDAYILNLPAECFVHFQFHAQRLKPDAFVAVAAYGDMGPSYICTEKSFAEGGYEPTASWAGPKSQVAVEQAIGRLLGITVPQ